MSNVSGSVIQVDEAKIRGHVDEVVRSSVEATLNGLLEAEADQLCGAKRYERTPDRVDTRAGSYERKLQTKAGEVTLQIPVQKICQLYYRNWPRNLLGCQWWFFDISILLISPGLRTARLPALSQLRSQIA